MAIGDHAEFSDSAVEQFLAVKQRASFVRINGLGDVRDHEKHDPVRSILRCFVWREMDKKHVRVLNWKNNEVYNGVVDL